MATVRAETVTFNRGEVAKTALARVDLAQLRLAAELQRNWVPKTYGPMRMRPPLEFVEAIGDETQRAKLVPFVFAMDDMALIEFGASGMRFWRQRNGATGEHPGTIPERIEPIERVDAGASFTNGTFKNGLTGWTIWVSGLSSDQYDDLEDDATLEGEGTIEDVLQDIYLAQTTASAGATDPIYPTVTSDARGMVMNVIPRGGSCKCSQTIALADGLSGVAVRIDVTRGPVIFRVDTPDGPAVFDTELETGYHSIAIPPSMGDYTFEFESRLQREIIVKSIAFEAAGPLVLPYYADGGYDADYFAGDFANIKKVRHYQTGDQMFMACDGKAPSAIERRSKVSFSHVIFRPEDGPFSADVTVKQVKLMCDTTEGNGKLYADRPFFRDGHVNALFQVFNQGYDQTFTLGAENVFTDPIRVTGTAFIQDHVFYSQRWITRTAQGYYYGSLTHRKSLDDKDAGYTLFGWPRVNETTGATTRKGGTLNITGTMSDWIDGNNQIIWHKFGFIDGKYSYGSITIRQQYNWGGGYGQCRVTKVVSSTECEVEILKPFYKAEYSDNWKEGEWSSFRGWPTAVGVTESRLFWAKKDQMYGSVSDIYDSHDIEADESGDSAAISRSVSTTGTVDNIRWILPLGRLTVGTEAGVSTIRSSSYDEPLTGSAFTARLATTQGAAPDMPPVRIDSRAIYAHRCGTKLMELAYNAQIQDYQARDLNLLNNEILKDGIEIFAVQRQPDTRVHVVRPDGTVAVFMNDVAEEVDCWFTVETDGVVEDVAVLPGEAEDAVYYIVQRSTSAGTRRFLEKWSLEAEVENGLVGGDSYVREPTEIDAFGHLEGLEVVAIRGDEVLADGSDDLPYGVITNGRVYIDGTPAVVTTDLKVGLPYTAKYKSPKLAYGGTIGTALLQNKSIVGFGFLLADAHKNGLHFGPDFDLMDPMPTIEDDEAQDENTVYGHYDANMTMWGGGITSDARICLTCAAPYSAVVLGTVFQIKTNG